MWGFGCGGSRFRFVGIFSHTQLETSAEVPGLWGFRKFRVFRVLGLEVLGFRV